MIKKNNFPGYLKEYENEYKADPKDANLQWFKENKFGLFIHYGLYSLLGRGEWVQYKDKIHVAEYENLTEQFTAVKFDADFITDLAIKAEMKYINMVAKHCDSFCLWDTKTTDFNSTNSPAGRDLIAEMAEACKKKGLGFFAFYEHGYDWRHPHGPAPWDWDLRSYGLSVRPRYDSPDPFYAPREEYDFNKYVDYVTAQITELCTNYGDLAGVWLDGAAVPHSGDKSKFCVKELYALIRRSQPNALISYKWGVEDIEDFLAPEEHQIRKNMIKQGNENSSATGSGRRGLPMEICTTMQKGGWGYNKDSEHLNCNEVLDKIQMASSYNANLLLNIGPLGDGSIHDHDVETLQEVGRYIRTHGSDVFK